MGIPTFVLAFAGGELEVDAEIAFVRELAAMAEALLRHANNRRGLTCDGEPLPLVLDVGDADGADASASSLALGALAPGNTPDYDKP